MNRPPLPPERAPEDHVYHSLTRGLCSTCGRDVDAKVWLRDDAVFFNKFCPAHGHEEVRVASSWRWYLHALGSVTTNTPPRRIMRPMANGCPRDCGPCLFHQQRTELAVVRSADALEHVTDIATVRLEGFAPDELEALVVRCREAGVARVELTTPQTPVTGATAVAIVEVTTEHGVDAAREWIALAAGGDADVELRTSDGVTTPDVLALLEQASDGALSWRDFGAAEAGHPLCYAIAPVGGRFIRVHDLMSAATFDMGRAVQCPTQVLRADGSSVPACIHDRLPKEFTA